MEIAPIAHVSPSLTSKKPTPKQAHNASLKNHIRKIRDQLLQASYTRLAAKPMLLAQASSLPFIFVPMAA
jgi:hypothetical protein